MAVLPVALIAVADGGCVLIGSMSSVPFLAIPSSTSGFITGFSDVSDGICTRSLGRLVVPFGLSTLGEEIFGEPGPPSPDEDVRLEGTGVPLCGGGTGEIIRCWWTG